MTDPLRPLDWDDHIGQAEVKRTMRIHIDAAANTNRLLPHTLLLSPPGYGKTTLARLIAQELNEPLHEVMMPINPKALVGLIRENPLGGILFLDEIHRARPAQQEDLLSALQDGYITTKNGDQVATTYFTFVAASTEPDKIIKPLRDRFKIKPMFDEYTDEEMQQIIVGMGRKLDVEFSGKTAARLGRAAAGTPRLAGGLVEAARALGDTGREPTVDEVLRLAGVDEDGLTHQHIAYLQGLADIGGSGGIERLMAMIQQPKAEVHEMERVMLKRGLISSGPGGRELLSAGYAKLKNNREVVATDDVIAERRRVKM